MKQYKAWELFPEEKVYLKSEADKVIAELKDKCQMHDFFWDGCGFAKRGFKNTISVSEAFDRLEAENRELKVQKAQAEDDCAYWKMSKGNAANAMHETEEYAMQLYNELHHQKRKRCLAMAMWCESENYTACWYHENSERCEWTEKWHKRWLELAEKFKEAK